MHNKRGWVIRVDKNRIQSKNRYAIEFVEPHKAASSDSKVLAIK